MATSTQNFSLTGANPFLPNPASNGMSSTTPMGAPAKAPQTAPPVNSLPPSQVKPPEQTQTAAVGNTTPGSMGQNTGNTGLVGNSSSINPNIYGQAATGLLDVGTQESPEVQAARSDLTKYQQDYADQQARNGQSGYTFNYAQGIENNTQNQYQQGLASRQTALQNALTGQGQKITALGGAASATAPASQLGFLTNPLTGKPIYGNGTIGGLSGLAYQAGQINNAGNLAGQGQGQAIAINNARNTTTQLSNLLKTSSLNQNQLAVSNWVGNVVAQNLSNPTLAPIQNAITSAVNQYAQAIGVSPSELTSSLLSQSGSQSILAVLGNLDTQAYNNYTNTGKVATGGGVAAPTTNLGTAQNTTSGQTTGGNKYVITP